MTVIEHLNRLLLKAFGTSESRTLLPYGLEVSDSDLLGSQLADEEDTGIWNREAVMGPAASGPRTLPPVNPELVNSLMRGIK